MISYDLEVVNNWCATEAADQHNNNNIIIIIIIIIRLSVTLVAWWGISFGRDSQPMLILVLTRTKKKNRIA